MKTRTKNEQDYLRLVRNLRMRRKALVREFKSPWTKLKGGFMEWDNSTLEAIGQLRLLTLPKPLFEIVRVLFESREFRDESGMTSDKWNRLVDKLVELRKHYLGMRVARKFD